MITQAYLTEWGTGASWPTATQIEQDLILSRLILEIADHPLLSRELRLRGGTCLHKLHLPAAYRYSEDLDYVRTSDDPQLGPIFSALREIAIDRVGLCEHRRRFPSEDSDMGCIWFDANPTSETGRIRVKIEINVAETEPIPRPDHALLCGPVAMVVGSDPSADLRAERAIGHQAARPLPASQGPRSVRPVDCA